MKSFKAVIFVFVLSLLLCSACTQPSSTYQEPEETVCYVSMGSAELLSYEFIQINGSCPLGLGKIAGIVRGTIYNKTSCKINYIEIEVKWCDWDEVNESCGEYVHTSYGYIYNLDPYQVKEFTAPEGGYCYWSGRGYAIQISDVK